MTAAFKESRLSPERNSSFKWEPRNCRFDAASLIGGGNLMQEEKWKDFKDRKKTEEPISRGKITRYVDLGKNSSAPYYGQSTMCTFRNHDYKGVLR